MVATFVDQYSDNVSDEKKFSLIFEKIILCNILPGLICIRNDVYEIMCKHFRKEYSCALQDFLCVLVARTACLRTRTAWREHCRWPLQSSSRFPFLCRRMYPIGTSEQQQCYELLNFIIQLDLNSSFHDSARGVARKWCERGTIWIFLSSSAPDFV